MLQYSNCGIRRVKQRRGGRDGICGHIVKTLKYKHEIEWVMTINNDMHFQGLRV